MSRPVPVPTELRIVLRLQPEEKAEPVQVRITARTL